MIEDADTNNTIPLPELPRSHVSDIIGESGMARSVSTLLDTQNIPGNFPTLSSEIQDPRKQEEYVNVLYRYIKDKLLNADDMNIARLI
jgi:hypothetical protein